MQYRLVYDIQQVGSPFLVPILISLTLPWLLGALAFLIEKSVVNANHRRYWHNKFLGSIIFGFVLLAIIGSLYFNYWSLQNASRRGNFKSIEGQIEQFVPMPGEGHSQESFVVNRKHFSYNDYDLSKRFRQSGPLHNGLQVRVSYVDDTIVRLEIADSPPDSNVLTEKPNLDGKP